MNMIKRVIKAAVEERQRRIAAIYWRSQQEQVFIQPYDYKLLKQEIQKLQEFLEKMEGRNGR